MYVNFVKSTDRLYIVNSKKYLSESEIKLFLTNKYCLSEYGTSKLKVKFNQDILEEYYVSKYNLCTISVITHDFSM